MFPADIVSIVELAEFITLERLCCPFLDFALEIPAGDNPITLRLTGEAGVKEVLQAEIGLT